MSLGAIKEDMEVLRRVGELLRQGETDKAYALMEQAFGPNSVEALKKVMSYGITPEKLADILIKAPESTRRIEASLKEKYKNRDKELADEIKRQAEAAKAEEIRRIEEAKEFAKRQAEFNKFIDNWRKRKEKLDKEDKKLEKEEKDLEEKAKKEKDARKRRKIEDEKRKRHEKRRKIDQQRKELEQERIREERKMQDFQRNRTDKAVNPEGKEFSPNELAIQRIRQEER